MNDKLFGKEVVGSSFNFPRGKIVLGRFKDLGQIQLELFHKEVQMNIYEGKAQPSGGPCIVTVNGKTLPPRNDLRNHSPDGFQWGYLGSGPAQLSLAILAWELGDQAAMAHYQEFKGLYISRIEMDTSWTLTSTDIERILSFGVPNPGE